MELGETIDLLYETRQRRLDLTKQADELKAQETKLKEELLDILSSIGLEKASGQTATVGIRRNEVPLVIEWEDIHQFIKTSDRFDLLQKRLSAPAWRELYQSGILVPGTVMGIDTELSLTKSTRS
jgi:hypothetical protein